MNIYVGNIAHAMSEDELRQAFEAFGTVDSVRLITDKFTGKSKGFGFVEMPDDAEAQAAIDGLNGKELVGRTVNVNQARPREERPRRPAGGGGGGFNRGGGFGGNSSGGSRGGDRRGGSSSGGGRW